MFVFARFDRVSRPFAMLDDVAKAVANVSQKIFGEDREWAGDNEIGNHEGDSQQQQIFDAGLALVVII